MVNLLQLLNLRTNHRRRPPRRRVAIPTGLPSTDAIFLLLRRMRMPLIVLIVNFSFCTAGMTLIPGKDAAGHAYRLTPFDAFYQMTMTVTTVGYTEAPYSFSYPQRMWMTLSIFLLVVSWAYALGALLSTMQNSAFQEALATGRFGRKVRNMREPFMIVVGYGAAGKAVGAELDKQRRRFVVIEHNPTRVEAVGADELSTDVPVIEADGRMPAALGLAGLGQPHCEAVLALTDDDEANLAVSMTASLLSPETPVIARCIDKGVQSRIEDFAPSALINPDDRYGGYLALSLHQPITHQVAQWLMDNDEQELPRIREGLAHGRWVVAADCPFGEEVTSDLRGAGIDVVAMEPSEPMPDLTGVAGFVAASTNDLTNIALAEHARTQRDDIYLAVRQRTNDYDALLKAMAIDSIYISTQLVAREVLARVMTPIFWGFIELFIQQDEQLALHLRETILTHCGTAAPERDLITIDPTHAPAVCEWLSEPQHTLTLGQLLSHPDDRESHLPLVALLLRRKGDEPVLVPSEDTPLQVGDELLVAGAERGMADVSDALFYPSTLEYLVTGAQVPTTWVWRKLTGRHRHPVA